MDSNKHLTQFVEIIKKLRSPNGGCPWDLEQTHDSLKPFLIEETYEVLHAIDGKNPDELKDELGDLLLQIMTFTRNVGSHFHTIGETHTRHFTQSRVGFLRCHSLHTHTHRAFAGKTQGPANWFSPPHVDVLF